MPCLRYAPRSRCCVRKIRKAWRSDGEKRKAVEVVANDVQFLGAKNGAGSAAAAAPDEDEAF
jgi:hypothetical protein